MILLSMDFKSVASANFAILTFPPFIEVGDSPFEAGWNNVQLTFAVIWVALVSVIILICLVFRTVRIVLVSIVI